MFLSKKEAQDYMKNKMADGGIMAKGGINDYSIGKYWVDDVKTNFGYAVKTNRKEKGLATISYHKTKSEANRERDKLNAYSGTMAKGGLIIGENDDDNKFPTKKEAFELIEDSVNSQGSRFVDEDGDGMFENNQDAKRYVDEVYDFLKYYYSLGMIPIYRSVIASEVDLDPYSIGESWSLFLENSKRFGLHIGSKKEIKIISAYVPKNNVDWEKAFRLLPIFSEFSDGESEFELPIPSNNKLYDVKVSDFNDAKELPKYEKGGEGKHYADGGMTDEKISDKVSRVNELIRENIVMRDIDGEYEGVKYSPIKFVGGDLIITIMVKEGNKFVKYHTYKVKKSDEGFDEGRMEALNRIEKELKRKMLMKRES
jgi:hypothetical protein